MVVSSGLNTSRHYLVGLFQTQLPAFGGKGTCSQSIGERLPQAGCSLLAGVAAGFGIMNQEPITIIGERQEWGHSTPFGISAVDARQHMYVIGKTGVGKTTLLQNMLVQRIERGEGVGLIDPHGDLAEELLNHIPPWRTDHL